MNSANKNLPKDSVESSAQKSSDNSISKLEYKNFNAAEWFVEICEDGPDALQISADENATRQIAEPQSFTVPAKTDADDIVAAKKKKVKSATNSSHKKRSAIIITAICLVVALVAFVIYMVIRNDTYGSAPYYPDSYYEEDSGEGEYEPEQEPEYETEDKYDSYGNYIGNEYDVFVDECCVKVESGGRVQYYYFDDDGNGYYCTSQKIFSEDGVMLYECVYEYTEDQVYDYSDFTENFMNCIPERKHILNEIHYDENGYFQYELTHRFEYNDDEQVYYDYVEGYDEDGNVVAEYINRCDELGEIIEPDVEEYV